MDILTPLLLVILFSAAHTGLCTLLVNRVHATALPYRFLKACDIPWYGFLVGMPVLFVAHAWKVLPTDTGLDIPVQLYGWLATAVGAAAGASWLAGRIRHANERRVVANHTVVVDAAKEAQCWPAANWSTRILSRIPGNEVFKLSIHEKTLELDGLPEALDGLSIVHLSDLHFTGRVDRSYFEVVVDQANRLDGDLLVITGDIIDKPCCLGWLTDVLGKLEARYLKAYVLGNHDLRVGDEVAVRRALESAGLVNLGGRWTLVPEMDWPVALAGNELPWFSPAAAADQIPDQVDGRRTLRIAVAHSPDQIDWARRYQFDLMLAGHTHGGQIRFPAIGPIFCPSRFGVRFASGTFDCPPTLMHVSRGLSGTRPLRFQCPPELAKLVLRPAKIHS